MHEGRRLNGFHGACAGPFGAQSAWQAPSLEKLGGSWPSEPTTSTMVSQPVQASLPEVPPATRSLGSLGHVGHGHVPPLNLEAAPWSSRLEVPSEISETRPSQASLPPPPASVPTGRSGNVSVPASRRGRSRPTSPMRSEYQWFEVGALPPVPPTALWFASKAEELERRRSRSAERPQYAASQVGSTVQQSLGPFDSALGSLGYAAVWPPPPLPPVSEDLRQRLEHLEARHLAEQDTLARTVEELTTELRSRGDPQQIQALEAQLETLRSSEKTLQAELSSSKLREEDAKKHLHRVEADRVRLETLIVTLEQQCSELRQELHDAKGRSSGDWQRLLESVKDLEAERDRLRKSYGDSERLLVEAHSENDALRHELRDLKEFKQRAIKAEQQLRELQEQLEDRASSEGRQLQAERQQARGLAQENQRLKKSLHDSEASVQSLRTQNLELEKEQRAWQKAEEESRKAAAILRQEVEKLREERQDLDRQVSSQERQSRRHHGRTSTLQPRPPDSGSSAHRSTVMEVDLRTEGKPQMEEKELEDSSSGSSNEYYEQEPPAHIKQRLASLQQAARFSVRQDLR